MTAATESLPAAAKPLAGRSASRLFWERFREDKAALLARGARDLASEVRATQRKLRGSSDHAEAVALVRKDLAKSKGVQELSRAFDQLHRLGYFR